MRSILTVAILLVVAQLAIAQAPTYQMILANDSVVSPTAYEFDIVLEQTNLTTFQLASLQPILTFDPSISAGTITVSMNAGSSDLNVAQQPTSMSIVGSEIRIDPRPLPGAGSGTFVPASPGLRVGRFRLTSSVPFNAQSANVAWKNSSDPFTTVFAYVSGTATEIEDSTGQLNQLANTTLLPATQVGFLQQPTTATAGAAISPAVTVQLENDLGGAVATSGVTVTLALSSGTGTLSGTLSALTDGSGVATFSNLSINLAGSKNLTASSAGLSSAVSNAFTISPGTPSAIVFTQQPTDAVAGTAIAPSITVQVQDAFGNNVPVSGVTVSMSLASGTGTLSGTVSRSTSAGGVATFDNLSIDLAGSKTLSAAATGDGLGTVVSNAFTITHAAAAKVVFIQDPTNVTAGSAITPPVTVQLEDTFGNAVPTAGTSVSLTLSTGTGVLSGGGAQLTNASGLATFSAVSINLTGSKNLTASSAGLTSDVSNAFTVSAAAAAKLVFVQQPTNRTAGLALTPAVTIQVQDAFGNNVLTSGTPVTVALTTGTGTLSGTLTQSTGASGLATFNDLSINLVGSKNLTASSAGLTSIASSAFTISAAAVSKVVFVQQPTNAVAGAVISPAVTVRLQDAFGNNISTSGTTISVALTTGTGTLSGTTSALTNASGVATFSTLSINLAGSKNLTASSTGLTSALSNAFTISPGSASRVVFVQQPTATVAGAAITPAVTVQLQDALGNSVPSSGVPVTMSLSSGTGVLGGTLTQNTDAGGLATFGDLSVNLAGSKNITASSAGLTSAVSSAFAISPGSASKVIFVQQPTAEIAGAAIAPAVTVQLQDALGNNVQASGVPVTMSLSSGTGVLSGTLTQSTGATGLASFNDLSINLTGSKNLTAASAGLTSALSSAFAITAGSATDLVFVQQPTNATAGVAIAPAVTVQLHDQFGNDVPASGIAVTMSLSSGTGTLGGTTTVTTNGSGLATFSTLSVNLAGAKGITASSGALNPATSNTFTISPAAAAQLVFIQQPTTEIAGVVISPAITVQLQDAFGNAVATSGVAVTLTLTTGTGTLSGTTTQSTNASGLATFNSLSINLTGSKNLTASSAGLGSVISSAFIITPAAAAKLGFVQQPTSATATSAIAPAVTVQVLDAFGNSVPSSGVAVTMSLSAGTGVLAGTLVRSTDATGLATFNDLSINLAGSKNITASASGLTAIQSSAFSILPGSATKVVFLQQPTNATAGVAIAPALTVQLQDASGNSVPNAGVSVTASLTTGSGVLSGTLTRATDGTGLATFNDLSINLAGAKNITAASAGLTSAVSAAFTISPAAATQLAFIQQPSGATAGAIISPSPTVQLRDNFGNNVPASGIVVTMALSAGTGTLSGTVSQSTNGTGLATFGNLSINLAGSKNLTASSTGLSDAVSGAFTIVAGAASRLDFIQQPTNATAGVAISPPMTVQIEDVLGNPVSSSGVTITLSLTTGTGTLSGTTSAATSGAGLASFGTVSINLAGSKNLTASGGGLTAAVSGAFTISPAAASQLVILQQPTGSTAGTLITPAVTAQLRDAFGNNVPSPGIGVTVALTTGTGVLSGTLTQPTSGTGLATFGDLSINLTGAKNLTVSSSGVSSALSSSFTIFPAPASQLVFVQQPTNALPGVAISPPVTVQIQDNFGNNVSATGVAIGMVLSSGTGTLSGTTTRSTSAAGLATFNDLSINTTGVKTLTASSGGLASALSNSFSIAVGAPTTVRVETAANGLGTPVPAQSLTSGSSITVYAISRDASGNFVANVAADSWSLQSVTGGVAAGDLVPSGDLKSAIFTGHLVGSAQIRATSGALTPVNSGTITVTPSAATQLAFVQQPSNGIAGAFIAPAITVQLRDAAGNAVSASGVSVAMALSAGTGALAGTTPQLTNASGLATFGNLSINQPGSKTLTASSAGLVSAVSTPFTLSTYTITASAGPNGSITPSGVVNVIHGTSQTFTMSANTGFSIGPVLVDGVSQGSLASFTFDSVTTNHTISVSFIPATLSITVQTLPPGLNVSVDGVTFASPHVFSWTAGTAHTIASDSLQTAPGSVRYAWTGWSDAGARSHTVSPVVNTTYTASFKTQFLLTVSANTGGTATPPTDYRDSASTVQITATPSAGYSFSSWSGSGLGAVNGSTNPANVTLRGPVSEVANFTLNNVLITVNTSPPGRTFYVDGVQYTSSTTFGFLPGSAHTLSTDSIQSQTSTARFLWSSWSDGDLLTHSFLVPFSNATYTASFKRQFFLTMNAGTGGSVQPPSSWRDSAAVVPISATPTVGFSFAGWTGSGSGSYTGPLGSSSVTMNGAITENASFTLFPVNVTITTSPAGRTYTVDGTTYTGTQAFVWSATASHTIGTTSPQGDTLTRYNWASWSDGGAQSHAVAPVSDTTFTVNFSTQYYLTMAAGTGGTASPASNWYNAGVSVPISATAGTGYSFANWSGTGTGSYTGGLNATSVAMNGPITETANFTANNISITVATAPAGRSVTVDGTTYTAPQTFTWVANSVHTIATDSLQNGATGVRYVWTGWNDGGAISHTVSSLINRTFTATFGTQYFLTMNAGTGGTATPASGWFASGQVVSITGIPGTGYSFLGWAGSGSGSFSGAANPASATMNAPVSETANFTPNTLAITVTTSPAGRNIIVDGITYTAPHAFSWVANTNHSIQTDTLQNGAAGTRYAFSAWSDGGARTHTVAPLVATTYTASFVTQYFLTMNTNVGGTVQPPSGWFNSGDIVPITATAGSGYGFLNWNGGGAGSYSGGNNPANVVMGGPITETANFAQNPYQVTVGTSPAGRAYRVNGTDYTTPQTFSVQPGNGLTVAIITTPQPGPTGTRYDWASWSDSGSISHFFTPTSDTVLVASFNTQYLLTTSAGTGGSVAPATNWFNSGTSVPITATPNVSYSFSTWTGTGPGSYTGPANPAAVTMNGPVSEAAAFTLFPVQMSVVSDPPGRSVRVDGTLYTSPQAFTFTSGTLHTIAADSIQAGPAGTRYVFASWSDAGARSHNVTLVKDTTFTVHLSTQFLLTTSAGTGGTASPASGWFDSLQVVPITATPSGGYAFSGWTGTGAGAYTGTLNPANVTMMGPVADSASFALGNVQVMVTTSPAGRTINVDGTAYVAPQTFNWVANSNHTIQTDSVQNGAAGTRDVWSGWSDGGSVTHVIAPSASTTFTASFTTQYYLTMATNVGGSVAPPSGWHDKNAAVSITALADNGYGFLSWSGSGSGSYSGSNNPATAVMTGPITETANFGQNAVLVTVRTSPAGRTFLVDGTPYTSIFTFSFLPGSVHFLSADSIQTVAGGTRFVWTDWSDSAERTHLVEIGARDSAFTVHFKTQYGLTTTVTPLLGGTIVPSGQTFYDVGDTAAVSATPSSGYAFTTWSGSIFTNANPTKVIMNGPRNVTGNFAPGARITLTSNPPGRTVVVDDSAFVAPVSFDWLLNSSHTIGTVSPQQLAMPIQYLYNRWSDSGAISHAITVTKDSVLTAYFGTQFYLFTLAGAGGTASPAEAWHNAGDTVHISATPSPGFGFIEWQGVGSGSYSGANSDASVIMGNWIVESATFGSILPPPTLSGIPDGATGVPPAPNLSWNAYPGATGYILQVATDSLFANAVYDSSSIVDSTMRVAGLDNTTRYYWRVKAKVGANVTTFSVRRSFTTRPKALTALLPVKPWVTRFVQTLRWTSVDLVGNVNVELSTNGGASYAPLLSGLPNSGSYTWRLPDATPFGNSCKVRIVSATDTSVHGETGTFAVYSGALPLLVPMSTIVSFPADPQVSTSYRLVSNPGIVDSTARLTDVLPGTPPTDWRMFWDNGGAENYLEELTPVSRLGTGRGYWLLKKKDFSFVTNMTMPVLDTLDASYAISLHAGWNIIANPFDKNIAWADVLDLNNLPAPTQLYAYGGSFVTATVLEPFGGYYFFNDTGLEELKMPYPFGPAPVHAAAQADGWRVQLLLRSDINDDPDNFIGVSSAAKAGLDENDSRKPPLFLDQGFLYFDRPEWDKTYPRFSADVRPGVGDGQRWSFVVSKPAGTQGAITFRGIEAVPAGLEVVLVNAYNTTPVDLRAQPRYTFTSVGPKMPFTLLVGTKEFVRGELAKEVPASFELAQNFPNPFNPTTSISVRLPRESRIRLDVYSILGQRVATLADGTYAQGVHTFVWQGVDDNHLPVATGVYLYRLLDGDNLVQTKKMILSK